MRRILAFALLIAFGSPLALALVAANRDPQASLPACCRRNGKHHCAMTMAMLATANDPTFAPPPCPLYPGPCTPPVLTIASLHAPLRITTEQIALPAPRTFTQRSAQRLAASAHLTRGPPARPI